MQWVATCHTPRTGSRPGVCFARARAGSPATLSWLRRSAQLLGKRWSPEQIAHELRLRYRGQHARRVCPETIYQAIYDPDVPLTRPAKTALRTGRRRRRRRLQGLERRGRMAAMTMIDQRPVEVADRVQAGHWEGDCIMGAGNKSAIGTLIERRTRFVILIPIPGGTRTADAIRDGITTEMTALPASLRRTLTWDQGKEMTHHLATAQNTEMGVYFCDAHSPWQRGSNENANGLLRNYFPKHSDLSRYSPQDLKAAALELNDRPRKTLGWATPADLMNAVLSNP